ncbi:MAG: HAD family hydrolase [Ktedonobacterales bacterium]
MAADTASNGAHGTETTWLRPGLVGGQDLADVRLDTALFDVDGVLIDTQRSYRLAVMCGSERLVRALGLDPPSPMVTQEDIAAFKLAGGFNNDWDLTRCFAALWTARLREWHGRPFARLTPQDWAARAALATQAGRGGITWVRSTFPATAIPTSEQARWAHDEFYWGAAEVRALFGHEPLYAPEARGFVANEELLLDSGALQALAALGITHLGLITGRVGPEVDRAVQALVKHVAPESAASPWHESAFGRSPFGSIVPATVYAKPDPRALLLALRDVGARAAVYVGDTADDLELVLRYRRESRAADPTLPPVLAVMVALGETARAYQARGADIIVRHVRELAAALALL